jgi:hydroxymethylpyrimidine pyrophosphatase-like HAD family hydrolase
VVTDSGSVWLVVTDVDGTLIGDDDGWLRLGESLAVHPEVLLIPNSSRPLASLKKSWARQSRPIPFRAQVGALGTEVSVGGDDVGWSHRFSSFDRTPIDRLMTNMGFQTNGDEFQTPLKASYAVPKDRWGRVAELLQVCPPLKVVTSGVSDFDAIPVGAGKHAPIQFLADRFRVDPSRVVAVGDSTNDLDMLLSAQYRIVVGNADPALIDAIGGRSFVSHGTHANGVLEGLQALGLAN